MINDNQVALSVIVPVYNVGEYVCDCLNSLLGQTFKKSMEIIVINDASTDDSFKIVQERYGKVPNMVFIQNKENLGLGETRNIGLRAARGKYVYFIDSDDALLPDCFRVLYDVAEYQQADVVHMSSFYVPEIEDFCHVERVAATLHREPLFQKNLSVKISDDPVWRLREGYAKQKFAVMTWLNLYRREFLLENKLFFSPIIHEDNPFAVAFLAATDRIWSVPFPYYIYRQRKNSITHERGTGHTEQLVQALSIGKKDMKASLGKYLCETQYKNVAEDVLTTFADGIIKQLEQDDTPYTKEQIDEAVRKLSA